MAKHTSIKRGVLTETVKLDAQELRMYNALEAKIKELVQNEVARIMATAPNFEARLRAIEECFMPDE